MEKRFRVRHPGKVMPCPQCGNDQAFVGRAERCAEDCCEVWIECGQCGHDPTVGTGDRLEDVWGSLDEATLRTALMLRDEHLEAEAAYAREDHDD